MEVLANKAIGKRRLPIGLSDCLSSLKRHRGGDANTKSDICFRKIKSSGELQSVYRLTHDTFVEMGFCEARSDGLLIHHPEYDNIPETTVFIATIKDQIVGTVSLTVDSCRKLNVDIDFKDACAKIRKDNSDIAELWRLAIKKSCRTNTSVISGLIRCIIKHARDMKISTTLIALNPRYENFYRRVLKMNVIGRNNETIGLANAPAVLMCGNMESCTFCEDLDEEPDYPRTKSYRNIESSSFGTQQISQMIGA